MAKYNITERKEKEAAYRTLVSPKLMDELKEKILEIILIQRSIKIRIILPNSLQKICILILVTFQQLSMFVST